MSAQDLTSRLREAAQNCSAWGIGDDIPPYAEWSDLMDEAAARIESLETAMSWVEP